jgi:hypothetical protein
MPIPTPQDLWGNCEIIGWEHKYIKQWNLWLTTIATIIIFAEQNVIDRVAEVVKDTVVKARTGELLATEAVNRISPMAMISIEEWQIINKNAKEQGEVVGKLFFSKEYINN